MRVSGRNRRQSYRGEEATMAFWLPLNASVFFAFFQTPFSIRDLPSNLTALCVTLCRLHFLFPRIVRHSSIRALRAFFRELRALKLRFLLLFLSQASFAGGCGRRGLGKDEVCRRVFKSYELDNFCNEIFVQDQ